MRMIKEGDLVQAFLDPTVKGIVEKVEAQKSKTVMVGGTLQSELYCVLRLENGQKIRYKAAELYHVY